jgi:hypothetical protein
MALTGMPGGREAARLDGTVRQDQSHQSTKSARTLPENSDTTDDCDRGSFQIKSASRAFVISAAHQANEVTAE